MAVAGSVVGSLLTVGGLAAAGVFRPRIVEFPVTQPAPYRSDIAIKYAVSEATNIPVITRQIQPALARVEATIPLGKLTGTAVALTADGYFLTSADLLGRPDGITMVLANGKKLRAEVIGVDRYTNLGVIRAVDAGTVLVPTMGADIALVSGSDAIVVSAADSNAKGPTVARGVVSSTGLRYTLPNGILLHDLVLTDANISLGVRGGVLIDSSGAVVGVIPTIGKDENGTERLILATPIAVALEIGERIIRYGYPADPVLGITGITLPPEQATALGITGGVRVDAVVPGSPAQVFGLAAGDVVITLDNTPVESMSTLVLALRRHAPGDVVRVGFLRNGTVETVAPFLGRPTKETGPAAPSAPTTTTTPTKS